MAAVSARRYSLLGGPAVDTYSIAEILAHSAGLTAVSLGNLCRSNVQRVTSLGRRMAAFVDVGEVIPDCLLLEVMIDHLSTLDGGWVLANFPRTPPQAVAMAEQGLLPTALVELEISDEATAARLAGYCAACRTTLFVHYRVPRVPGTCDMCGCRLGPRPDDADRMQHYRSERAVISAHFRSLGRYRRLTLP